MKIVASIEARMTSSRFPGKVLLPILSRPILALMIERVKKAKLVDEIVVATTTNRSDDIIDHWCQELGVSVFRGSEDDVLDRVVKAHEFRESDIIVELTGDCPFVDPEMIDEAIRCYQEKNVDYVSNNYKRTFPDGTDIQVFSFKLLESVAALTKDPLDREHVSKFIYTSGKYEIFTIEADAESDLFWPDLAITLDTLEDYQVIKNVFEHFGNTTFKLAEILTYLRKNPEVIANKHIKRKGLT